MNILCDFDAGMIYLGVLLITMIAVAVAAPRFLAAVSAPKA